MVAYVDEFRDRFRAGIGRDRPRPGDERHAGTGNPRRAPRRDSRHRQTGEGRGRRARLVERGFEAGAPNRPHRSSGCRTPERTETGYYANQAAQAASL